jgi:hypothetical protein
VLYLGGKDNKLKYLGLERIYAFLSQWFDAFLNISKSFYEMAQSAGSSAAHSICRISAPDVVNVAMEHVFDNLYVANTFNRLRALANPSDSDRKRWIYELL